LLALVAMEPPTDFDPTAVRDEKVKVLRSLHPIDAASVGDAMVTGQYEAGVIDGAAVPGYDGELGRDSQTETFVALKAGIDNWRWSGVPFYLRTGKRLAARHSEIFIQFKCIPFSIFAARGAKTTPNKLIIGLQPNETIGLAMMAKTPGLDRQGIRLRELQLDLGRADAFADHRRRIAYERLLLDLIEGNPTLFVRRDEVEAQWQWIDGIRAAWAKAGTRPEPYAAGTRGPSGATDFARRHGFTWHD
jgi:glucose-6-phosphate 1-dehydrogenase